MPLPPREQGQGPAQHFAIKAASRYRRWACHHHCPGQVLLHHQDRRACRLHGGAHCRRREDRGTYPLYSIDLSITYNTHLTKLEYSILTHTHTHLHLHTHLHTYAGKRKKRQHPPRGCRHRSRVRRQLFQGAGPGSEQVRRYTGLQPRLKAESLIQRAEEDRGVPQHPLVVREYVGVMLYVRGQLL